MIGAGITNFLDTIRSDTPRGRDYSDPIGDMVASIPPGTPLTPTAISAELYDTRLWSLALINASMSDILARIKFNCVHAARASGGR